MKLTQSASWVLAVTVGAWVAFAQTSGDVLVPQLNGVVIVGSDKDFDLAGVTGVKGLQVKGPVWLQKQPKLEKALAPYFGKPLTTNALAGVQREIVAACQRLDHLVVDVFYPFSVRVQEGIVQIAVIEGKLGQVTVVNGEDQWWDKVFKNKVWYSDRQITNHMRLRAGEPVKGSQLDDDLAGMNRNPDFRSVAARLKAGKKLGETDLEVVVKDRFPLRFSAAFEDTGNKILGEQRAIGGFTWANFLFLDQVLNYQYTVATENPKLLQSHTLTYQIPTLWNQTLTLFGAYAKLQPDLAAIDQPELHYEGETYQLSARYAIPLGTTFGARHELSAGFDFKRTDNNFEFISGTRTAVLNKVPTDVDQFVFGYRVIMPDRLGYTRAGVEAFWSPGGLTENNDDLNFQRTSATASADYYYWTVEAERMTKLPLTPGWLGKNKKVSDCWAWRVRGAKQFAPDPLLPSEQFSAGGRHSVRGYTERYVSGDEGWMVSNELLTPEFNLDFLACGSTVRHRLQILGFYDYASVETDTRFGRVTISSVGVGFRYAMGRMFAASFDYGFELTDRHVGWFTSKDSSRGHFSLRMTF